MKHEHIMIMRFSEIGDVELMVPVVRSLAQTYPDLRITVLSSPFARALFKDLAANVFFMEADLKNEYRGIKGLNKLYRRLAAKQFTSIADFHGVLRSGFLRMRFNINRYKVEHIDKQPTQYQDYADVLARLGYTIDVNSINTNRE